MNEQNSQSNTPETRKRKVLIWSAVAVAVVLVAFFLRDPLLNWFFPDRATTGKTETVESAPMPPETVEEVRSALGAYEHIRLLLAADTIDGLGAHADELAALLRGAREYGLPTGSPVSQQLQEATAIADQLREASSIEQARSYFGELSAHLIAVVAEQPELRAGWHLFSCPMVEEPNNRWLQPSDEIENPFMGQAMSGCGSVASWPVSAPSVSTTTGGGVHLHDGEEIAHWTCPMHPSVKQAGPGQCPICGMDLLPVSKRDIESGVLLVDDAARRRIGVKTAVVEEKPVELVIRAVGRTTFDESRLRDVTLKLKGFVERLYVNETGQSVRRGQPLLAIYSPELYSAQQEYLLAVRSQQSATQSGAPNRADYLVRAARERLRLWDISQAQIRQIEERGEPLERMPILSPVSGYVIEKDVVEGMAVQPGQRLYRVASLDAIWVEADVYEQDLPHVKVGQNARITFPYVEGETLAGRISYVYPYLDPQTRTGKVRIQMPNPKLELRPEMYANVEIRVDRGVRLVVPESAVIRTGPRELVFLDLAEGRLQPKQVRLGVRGDSGYEVLSGLSAGDRVVTSANFLISSESRLRSAEDIWGGGDETE